MAARERAQVGHVHAGCSLVRADHDAKVTKAAIGGSEIQPTTARAKTRVVSLPAPQWSRLAEPGRENNDGDSVTSPPNERAGGTRYLRALLEHWLLILVLMAVAVLAAWAYARTAEQRYEASADVLVTPIPNWDATYLGIDVLRESNSGEAVVTAARLITRPSVAEAVKRRLQVDEEPESLVAAIEAQPQSQSNVLAIAAEHETPEGAATLANAFADVLVAQRTQRFQRSVERLTKRLSSRLQEIPKESRGEGEGGTLQGRLAQLQAFVGEQDPTVQVSSRAVPPSAPVWPRPLLTMWAAALGGLLFGIAAAIALHLASPYVRREEELLEQNVPVLARVPRLGDGVVREFLQGRRALPAHVVEAYRTLRATLSAADPNGRFPASIAVTSPTRDEPRTTVAVSLAAALTLAGWRVVLVDADLQRAQLTDALGLGTAHAGLATVLAGDSTLEEALVPVGDDYGRLEVLPLDRGHPNVVDRFEPERIERMIGELHEQADVVVFDSASALDTAEGVSLAKASEAILITVGLRVTRRDRLNQLRLMLGQLATAPAGFVVISQRRAGRRRDDVASFRAPATFEPLRSRGRVGERVAPTATRSEHGTPPRELIPPID